MAIHHHPHSHSGIRRLDLLSQSYCMNIIWLMKLTLIALTVSTSLSFASQLSPTVPGLEIKKVEGLIVVEASPVIVYQK
jgi:hypothetical protein